MIFKLYKDLFYRYKASILIDEIDGLSGTKDRGGLGAVKALIADAQYPVIMTVANPYDFKLSSLKSKTNLIKFEQIDYKSIFELLKQICKKEKVVADDLILKGIATRAGGDVRAAINDYFKRTGQEGRIVKLI